MKKRPLPTLSLVDDVMGKTDEPTNGQATAKPKAEVHRTSLYIPKPMHEALRTVAFHHNLKEHDIIMQALDAALVTKYGMASYLPVKAK